VIENILALLSIALPLMGSPGPAIVSLAATGAAFGFMPGRAYLLGILCGNTTVLLLAASGLTGLILLLPNAVPILTTIGLGYLLYLAYRIATAPATRALARDAEPPGFKGGYLLSLVNPKAYAAIGAAYASGSVTPDNPHLDAVLKVALLIGVNITVNTAWLQVGSVFSTILRNPRTGRALKMTLAGLLLASVAYSVLR
jgi:threonine/homoserine/homoserine lactone efflux protein